MAAIEQRSRKETALRFLNLAAAGQAREAFRAYASAGFRHHNPSFRGDADSLAAAMDDASARNPQRVLEVQRVLEDVEAGLVAIHARVRLQPRGPAVAVVHIYRFEGDLIAELWDVGQPVPDDAVNENGMF
ncbi:MAG TPA: nuclear transport factor 2 family protein [Polyangia bacterium]|nr:nuclear transport factor 2 family protein [Polyangia bacterium]